MATTARVTLIGVEDFPVAKGCCGCSDLKHDKIEAHVELLGKGDVLIGDDGKQLRDVDLLDEPLLIGDHQTDGDVVFPENVYEYTVEKDRSLQVRLCFLGASSYKGYVKIPLKDLVRQSTWRLMVVQYDNNKGATINITRPDEGLYGDDKLRDDLAEDGDPAVRRPTFLYLQVQAPGVQQDSRPDFEPHRRRPRRNGRPHVMLVTRGTRGDVQPFVSLARGLIMEHNCDCTIVTELCQKDFVKKARVDLPPDSLKFRPSGGDTMSYTSRALMTTVMGLGAKVDALQTLFFSMSEGNFFESEGAFFYWAYQENPDFLVFGFTLTHISMIISEALQIPLVGFILQPSREVEPRHHLQTSMDIIKGPSRKLLNSEEANAFVAQTVERATGLNAMRESRGLHPCPPDVADKDVHYRVCMDAGVQFIAPIDPAVFTPEFKAAHPEVDGDDSMLVFTKFIFLNLSDDAIDKEVQAFIDKAKRDNRKVGLMTFSSMPVGEQKMFDVAKFVVEACKARGPPPQGGVSPALILIAAGQDKTSKLTAEQEALAAQLLSEGRLLVLRKGQPFHTLFPKLDFALMHGGLGVTSEAMIAGIPVITSGIQLLDQRWWGARMAELGCGSAGTPLDRLTTWATGATEPVVVTLVNNAIDCRDRDDRGQPTWPYQARKLQQIVTADKADPDGISNNARVVWNSGAVDPHFIKDAYADDKNLGINQLCRQVGCCLRFAMMCLRCCLVAQCYACLMACFTCCTWCVFKCCPCCYRRAQGGIFMRTQEDVKDETDEDMEALVPKSPYRKSGIDVSETAASPPTAAAQYIPLRSAGPTAMAPPPSVAPVAVRPAGGSPVFATPTSAWTSPAAVAPSLAASGSPSSAAFASPVALQVAQAAPSVVFSSRPATSPTFMAGARPVMQAGATPLIAGPSAGFQY